MFMFVSLVTICAESTDGILFTFMSFSLDTALGTQLRSVDFHCMDEAVKDHGERYTVSSIEKYVNIIQILDIVICQLTQANKGI